MKQSLIQRYYELASVQKEMLVSTEPTIGYAAIIINMKRLDTILHERYGYDVSLTRKK